MLGGVDPDFHRRDLYDAIEAGAFPQWELGIQAFEDNEEQMFQDIDLLDITKMVPEELAPVQPIGLMTLNGNPTNFFAEVEQVAYCTAHLVPGIDHGDDPMLAARNFSYLDTQLTRLGGPNFDKLPINRPHTPVNSMHRDGFGQDAVHGGIAPYKPNSLDGGCPFTANGKMAGALTEAMRTIPAGVLGREKPASFDDHYSQPRQFWLSMTAVEQTHIIAAYTFELGKCFEQTIKERALTTLANIDPVLCGAVAAGLGLEAPKPTVELVDLAPSAALSQLGETWPVMGRQVAIVVGPDPGRACASTSSGRTDREVCRVRRDPARRPGAARAGRAGAPGRQGRPARARLGPAHRDDARRGVPAFQGDRRLGRPSGARPAGPRAHLRPQRARRPVDLRTRRGFRLRRVRRVRVD